MMNRKSLTIETRILKYFLTPTLDKQVVILPKNADILHFGEDEEDTICLWARVVPEREKEARIFKIFPTGSYISKEDDATAVYQDTVITRSFVMHVYEMIGLVEK